MILKMFVRINLPLSLIVSSTTRSSLFAFQLLLWILLQREPKSSLIEQNLPQFNAFVDSCLHFHFRL